MSCQYNCYYFCSCQDIADVYVYIFHGVPWYLAHGKIYPIINCQMDHIEWINLFAPRETLALRAQLINIFVTDTCMSFCQIGTRISARSIMYVIYIIVLRISGLYLFERWIHHYKTLHQWLNVKETRLVTIWGYAYFALSHRCEFFLLQRTSQIENGYDPIQRYIFHNSHMHKCHSEHSLVFSLPPLLFWFVFHIPVE